MQLRAVIWALLSVTLTLSSIREPVAQPRPNSSFRVINVRLFDGAKIIERTQVAVVAGTIRAVGADLREWRDLPTVDGAGSTLLPGLIDAHAHVREAGDLRQSLRFGVTTVLDMGAVVEPRLLFALRKTANASPDMSDLRLAGTFAWSEASAAFMATTGLMDITVPPVTTVEEAQQLVAARHAEGADYLKIGLSGVQSAATQKPNLGQSTVAALVEAARAHGMLAIAHIEDLNDVRMALAAGVDGLAHAWRTDGADAETARRLAERKAFVVATLSPPAAYVRDGNSSLLADRRFSSAVTDAIREHLNRPLPGPPALRDTQAPVRLRTQMAAVRSIHEAGATLLVGTDATRDIPVAFGISLHRELELLKDAGLHPTEVLAAATANTAAAFRLQDRGRIITGRRADMLLVRGNPTVDILATRDILRVWKGGVEVDRSAAPGTRD